mmetsp:Transcript_37612/g.82502  ORF Transcript_37612/g.82502 Transcript_37612/m.82502 type:complete len:121 (+) Transcript_37612:585-947(+)
MVLDTCPVLMKVGDPTLMVIHTESTERQGTGRCTRLERLAMKRWCRFSKRKKWNRMLRDEERTEFKIFWLSELTRPYDTIIRIDRYRRYMHANSIAIDAAHTARNIACKLDATNTNKDIF